MLSPYNSMVCAVWMIRSRMASAIVGSPTMSYQLGDGYCEVMIVDFLSCLSSIISSRIGRSLAGAGKRMCQNEPNPESQIKDFRGFSSFRELGNAANGIFYSSQCWENRFSPISCFPNVGKAVFRWFLVFPMLGKSIFVVFWFSPVRESRFSPISCFPPWGKADFHWFLVFPRSGKAIFANFWVSPVAESRFSLIFDFPPWRKVSFCQFSFIVPLRKLLFPFFVHRTPTKASFSRFSPVVPLRKLLFANFRSSYPYESFFFPFFINCNLYLSDFSWKIDDLCPYLSSFSYWAVSDCWFSKRHLCFDTASSAVCIACICVLFHYSLELVSKSEVRVRMRNFQAFRALLYNVASVCCKILRETGRQEEHLSSH